MKTITVLGDINVDLIFSGLTAAPAMGQEVLGKEYKIKIGGSAANTACVLALAGCPVRFFGVVGNDFFGRWIIGELEKYGLDTGTIRLADGQRTGVTVSLTYPSDRMYITDSGTVATSGLKDMRDGYLTGGGHLHLAACFLQKKLKPAIGDLIRRAKQAGMTTSLDPGYDPNCKWDLAGLKPYWQYLDFFMPNEKELKSIAGIDNMKRALAVFPPPAVKGVVVKTGAQGALLRYSGKVKRYPAPAGIKVIDTSCAGDCFNAGFLLGINRGDPVENAVRLGNRYGAAAVSTVGLPEKLPAG